jgi:hypothetical protein
MVGYNFSLVSRPDALQQTGGEGGVCLLQKDLNMAELSIDYFAQRIEELRRDWPLLLADADIGQRLFAEITGAGFDDAMRALLCAREAVPTQPTAAV